MPAEEASTAPNLAPISICKITTSSWYYWFCKEGGGESVQLTLEGWLFRGGGTS